MKVARSTYYSILNHKASSREIENNILKSKIFKIYCDNRKVYGCIKITRILREDGYPKLSVNRVSRLMKQLGIRSITIRKFKNYRNKQNEHSELKNLVNQNFSAQKPNQIWLSDITYIHTVKNGWTYLASVLDVCTRKIVGYSYGRKMDRSLVISALTNSWQNQNYPNNVILHSDRGSQYTSSEYIAAAERMGFRLSYSKKGCPFDNAPMESFHSVLKKEEVYLKHYSSFHEANIRLFDYINGFYNRNRIHSAINFLSPIQFENSLFYSYFFSPFCVQIIDYGPKNGFIFSTYTKKADLSFSFSNLLLFFSFFLSCRFKSLKLPKIAQKHLWFFISFFRPQNTKKARTYGLYGTVIYFVSA